MTFVSQTFFYIDSAVIQRFVIGMVWYTRHSTQYRSFQRWGPWAVMYISHSAMEGQWH